MSEALVILFAVVVIAFVIASFARPAYVIGFLICSFAFEQWLQANSSFFVANLRVVNYAAGVMLVIAVYIAYQRGRTGLNAYPATGKVILALYILAYASYLWSVERGSTMTALKGQLPYVLVNVVAAPLLVSDSRDLRDALKSLLVFGGVVLTLIVATATWDVRGIQLANQEFVLGQTMDTTGAALSLATLGGYIAILAMIMNYERGPSFWRIIRWPLLGVAMFMVVRSQSRGQLLATIFTLMIFLPMSRRVGDTRNNTGILIAMTGLVLLTYKLYDMYFIKSRFSGEKIQQAYGEGRLQPTKILIQTMIDAGPLHWILGLGNSASFGQSVPIYGYPHFVIGEVLGEEGLIGFVLFSLIPILLFISMKRCWPAVRDNSEMRGIFCAIAALFFFEFMLSFKQGSLLRAQNLMAFAIIGGIFSLSVTRQWTAYMAQYTQHYYQPDAMPATRPANA